MAKRFFPIWKKDNHEFFLPYHDFSADTEDEAHKVMIGTLFGEAILYGFEYAGRIMEIDTDNVPHIKAKLKSMDVCVIAGPSFDKETDEHTTTP